MRDLLRIYRCIRAMVIITGITPKVANKVKSDPVTELDELSLSFLQRRYRSTINLNWTSLSIYLAHHMMNRTEI